MPPSDPISSPNAAQRLYSITIDSEACVECRLCESACPAKAITMGAFSAQFTPGMCQGCGYCVQVCPTGAITMQ